MLTAEESKPESLGFSPSQQTRRESWVSTSSSRRDSRVLQNDLLLHEAVIKNEAKEVKKILKETVDVNSRNNYGRAPIHWASSRGSLEIMAMLIHAKCDIEAQDKYGMRPLLMAAWHGHKDATKLLINAGANVTAVNKKQYTVLICAAKNNRREIIDFLVDALDDVKVDEMDIEHQTALHHASSGGHVETVKKLLEMGASVNCTDINNRTPLHVASEKGHVEVVDVLLEKNVDMYARDNDGNTPLHLSVGNKQTGVVKSLLEKDIDSNSANEKGLTALHIACDLGCRGIIESLLDYGSDINAQSKTGNTPIHLACRRNEPDIVELLISKGADVNKLNIRLQSPIHIAAENGFGEICKILLAAGADTTQKEQGGKTPMYVAARGSFTAIVDMIIKTARLDYSSPEDDSVVEVKARVLKRIGRNWRQPNRNKPSHSAEDRGEKLKHLFHKIAYKYLNQGEWKKLAYHWSFTQDQVQAIELQYIGSSSYKEHGFRLMSLWAHELGSESNPIKELSESLVAIGNKKAADALQKHLNREEESSCLLNKTNFLSCLIL